MNTKIPASRVSLGTVVLREDRMPASRANAEGSFRDTVGSVIVIVAFIGLALTLTACLEAGISLYLHHFAEMAAGPHRGL